MFTHEEGLASWRLLLPPLLHTCVHTYNFFCMCVFVCVEGCGAEQYPAKRESMFICILFFCWYPFYYHFIIIWPSDLDFFFENQPSNCLFSSVFFYLYFFLSSHKNTIIYIFIYIYIIPVCISRRLSKI